MGKTVVSSIRQQIQKRIQLLRAFFTKLGNDWVMNSAAGLAYNLINATIPIAIFILAVLGFTIGNLDNAAYAQLIERLKNILPAPFSAKNILGPALTTISSDAGFLTILALLAAIFGGSRLFITIEGYFDIIYRTGMRKPVAQNVMAVLMLGVFIILAPLMVFASSIPALILWLAQNTTLSELPGVAQLAQNSLVLSAVSILESVIVTWLLFQAIYIVVPNQKMSFKNTWKGAVIAALLLEIFLLLFPLYITHFMGTYTGAIGFILLFLFFFYYFAVILLIGAEVNAYAAGVRALPANLADYLRLPIKEAEKEDTDDLNWF